LRLLTGKCPAYQWREDVRGHTRRVSTMGPGKGNLSNVWRIGEAFCVHASGRKMERRRERSLSLTRKARIVFCTRERQQRGGGIVRGFLMRPKGVANKIRTPEGVRLEWGCQNHAISQCNWPVVGGDSGGFCVTNFRKI